MGGRWGEGDVYREDVCGAKGLGWGEMHCVGWDMGALVACARAFFLGVVGWIIWTFSNIYERVYISTRKVGMSQDCACNLVQYCCAGDSSHKSKAKLVPEVVRFFILYIQ